MYKKALFIGMVLGIPLSTLGFLGANYVNAGDNVPKDDWKNFSIEDHQERIEEWKEKRNLQGFKGERSPMPKDEWKDLSLEDRQERIEEWKEKRHPHGFKGEKSLMSKEN